MRRTLGAFALLLILSGGWYGYRLAWGVPLNINHFSDRTALLVLWEFPEFLTMFGLGDNTPLDFHSHRFSDLSPEAERERVAKSRRSSEQLRSYHGRHLSGQRALTREYLDWSINGRLSLYDAPYHFSNLAYSGPYPLNQTSGAQETPLEVLSQYQQVLDEASANRYLQRVSAIPAFLGHLTAAARYRADLGVVPPRVVLERLITRAEHLLAQPVDHWSIYSAFASKLTALELDEGLRDALLDKAWAQVEMAVIPAYEDYLDVLQELLDRAPDTVGLWALPDGDAYYDSLLRYYTTSDLSAEEIHALGLARVAAITREMSAALAALGHERGSLADRIHALAGESPWAPGEAGRGQVLARFRALVEELGQGTESAFRGLSIDLPEVRAVPRELELGSPLAYYSGPPLDGSRPGYFYVNLRDPSLHQPFGLRTLAAHEAVPGHHLQIVAGRRAEGLPLSRRIDVNSAFAEGWALYAERLVAEMGLHDPASDVGRLQAEMFRAVRLVVDTGIHRLRWTREQAIDYMMEHTGQPRAEVVSEIERYIAEPGQACSYMVGMLEILRLREEARARQGERFSLEDFHLAVLENGALPLTALRRQLESKLR